MKIIILLSLLLFMFCATVTGAPVRVDAVQNVESLLKQREVLCSVDFAPNSIRLSPAARNTLEQVVSSLKRFDFDAKMLRIEGFASPDGDKVKNFRLSIKRALAVERFLRVNHGVSLNNYVTGYGPTLPDNLAAAGTRRVEIAVYDNPWTQENIPVVLSNGQ